MLHAKLFLKFITFWEDMTHEYVGQYWLIVSIQQQQQHRQVQFKN